MAERDRSGLAVRRVRVAVRRRRRMEQPERLSRFLTATCVAAALVGCTPAAMVVGAGSWTGLAAYDERGIDGRANDALLQLKVAEALLSEEEGDVFWPVSTLVHDGRALLVGNVDTEIDRQAAVAAVGGIEGIVAVIDNLEVGPRPAVFDDAQDTLISQRLGSALLFDSEVKAVNFGVLTHNAIVYLMGVARSDWERDRVIAHARNTAYVRGVISHLDVLHGAATAAGE